MIKVEGAALYVCLSPELIGGVEGGVEIKASEEFKQTELVSSEQKEKTWTYKCPFEKLADDNSVFCHTGSSSLTNLESPTLSLDFSPISESFCSANECCKIQVAVNQITLHQK